MLGGARPHRGARAARALGRLSGKPSPHAGRACPNLVSVRPTKSPTGPFGEGKEGEGARPSPTWTVAK